MKTLYLLRHSGTLATSPSGRDIDRRLSAEGIRDAETIAEFIAGSDPSPQIILTSPAVRARETAAFAAAKLDIAETTAEEIYEARTATLVDIVRPLGGGPYAALMVGHSPGLASLAEFFTGTSVAMHAPSVAKIEFDIDDWKNAERYYGKLAGLHSAKS